MKLIKRTDYLEKLINTMNTPPKILIARTHHGIYTYEGIQIIDIKDWLNKN